MIPSPSFNSIILGPLTIHLYGLIIGIALATTYVLAHRCSNKQNLTSSLIDQIYLYTIPISLIGARAYHVLSNLDLYLKNPISILFIWQGGIGILGGIVAGACTIFIIARNNKIPFLKLTDFLAPLLALGQSIGRWGNYFNQELYGLPTILPWAIQIDPKHRLAGYAQFTTFHPLFLYESIANLINFFLLLKLSHHSLSIRLFNNQFLRINLSPTSFYLIFYGFTRFVLEFIKIDPDSSNILFGLKTAQYLSLTMFIAGLIITFRHKHQV